MTRMRRVLLLACLAGLAWFATPGIIPAPAFAQAPPAGGWKSEFEAVCAKTQDAMLLSSDELRSLVERCDKLKPLVEALSEPERKVYSKRLAACRSLYAYVLESR